MGPEPHADIILPAQFFSAGSALPVAERRLRLAILEEALRTYRQYAAALDRRGRGIFEETAAWFASPDRSASFSFENVCDALGLEPDYVRRGLRQWERGAGGPLPTFREPVRGRRARTRHQSGAARHAA